MGRWIALALFWPLLLVRLLARRAYLSWSKYNTLRLVVEGSLPDTVAPTGLLGTLRGNRPPIALVSLLIALRRAEHDRRLARVVVRLGPLTSGLARAQELQCALQRVSDTGKEVIVFAEEYGLLEFTVALGATQIILAPPGSVNITGIATELTFYQTLLDKIGVTAHLHARGKYKSAREPWTRSSASDANREMTGALVEDLYERLIMKVSERRKLEPGVVRAEIDEGPLPAAQALRAGFVDALQYAEDLDPELNPKLIEDQGWRCLSLSSYLSLTPHLSGKGKPRRVAVLSVTGQIKSGRSAQGPFGPRATGARTFQRQVKRLCKDGRWDAVVLRVDSPGGSALASDLMWKAAQVLKERTQVVVSMVNVAASGGYYVAGLEGVPIFASEATITGSIGVLGGRFDARTLYDKLGISKEIVARGKRAGHLSSWLRPTEEDLARNQRDVDHLYDEFVTKMAAGRQLTREQLDAVAQGRVWTGNHAKERRLVDRTGGLMPVLDHLRGVLGVGPRGRLLLEFVNDAPRFSIRTLLMGTQDPEDRALDALPASIANTVRMAHYFEREQTFTLLPYDIVVR